LALVLSELADLGLRRRTVHDNRFATINDILPSSVETVNAR
jgi:hypothetical protein